MQNNIQAACRLAEGEISKVVATEVGVVPETLSHWKRNSEFAALINKLMHENIEGTRNRLRHFARRAVESLGNLAENAESEEIRRKAACDLLTFIGFHGQESPTTGIGPLSALAMEKKAKEKKVFENLNDSLLGIT